MFNLPERLVIYLCSYLPAWLEPENFEGGGDNHPLLFVIRRRDTLESLEPFHGFLSSLGFVGNHSSDCPPEHLRGGTEVEGATCRLDIAPQSQELQHFQLVPIEVARKVDALAPHNDDLITVENVLGHDGGQTAHQMAAAINHHRLHEKIRHNGYYSRNTSKKREKLHRWWI